MTRKLVSWVPLALFVVGVIFTTVGGNDKMPYLVLLSGVISVIIAVVFMAIGTVSRDLTSGLKNILISALPVFLLTTIFILGRYGLVDSLKLIGFR